MGFSEHYIEHYLDHRTGLWLPHNLGDPFGVLLSFSKATFSNGDSNRYWWDQINKVLAGPFGANELAWGTINGRKYASIFEAVTETTGHTEDFSAWSVMGSASVTSDQITSPDPDKQADKLTFTASASDGIKIALTSASDNTNQTCPLWVRTASGTKEFRLGFLRKDNTTSYSSDKVATTTWQRFDFTADILSGATAPEARIINNSGGNAGDIYIWGGPVHKDKSYPWSYRTNETGSEQLQAKDQIYWPAAVIPEAIKSGKWAFTFAPHWSSDDSTFGGSGWLVNFNDGGHGIILWTVSKKIELWDGSSKVQSNALTWSRYQPITVIIDPSDNSLEISGATTGNGKVVGSSWDWSDMGSLHWANDTGGDGQKDILISEPYQP